MQVMVALSIVRIVVLGPGKGKKIKKNDDLVYYSKSRLPRIISAAMLYYQ